MQCGAGPPASKAAQPAGCFFIFNLTTHVRHSDMWSLQYSLTHGLFFLNT
jgi:hypothetical protein